MEEREPLVTTPEEGEVGFDPRATAEALRAQAEEAALDHGSVERLAGRTAAGEGAGEEFLSEAEEAALDQGSVDRIAADRTPPRSGASRSGSAS